VRPIVPQKKKRFKHPNSRARVLCKHDGYTFYDDHTFRFSNNLDLQQWDIVPFPRTGHNVLFFRYGDDEDDIWQTEYDSCNEEEIALGEAVAKAMADNEVKKMLTGQYDEAKESDKIVT
jgi:hypothetical protein